MSDSTTSHHNFEFIQSGFFYFSAERLEKNPTLLKRYRQMPVSQIDDQQYVATMIHRTCSISNEIINDSLPTFVSFHPLKNISGSDCRYLWQHF
ncbi:unnamed protein product [Tenebrio molitor]|nr:unnamed protein product [Tenebrio molitor]